MQFPSLHELTISGCPKLSTVSPLSLPVLHSLKFEKCHKVVLESFCDLGSLNSLKVESVAGLRHLPRGLVQSMTNVEVLECWNCNELSSVWPNGVVVEHLSSLRSLLVANCALFVSLEDEQQKLPRNLEILKFIGCGSLEVLPSNLRSSRCLTELTVSYCHGIADFPGRAIPRMLKHLRLLECNGLESLPSDVSTLERLEIRRCPSLRNWSAGNLPCVLRDLRIFSCKELDTLVINLLQHMHNFPHLTKLILWNCDGLEFFPEQGLPPNLKTLNVRGCSNLRSLPSQIQNAPSIASITVCECRMLESFPGCDLPPNLSELYVRNCGELKPLSLWGLHRLASLKEFTIWGGFEELQLLDDAANRTQLFPSSLINLDIGVFRRLKSVSGALDNLTSLQHLKFKHCGSLGDLPSETILEKLWSLQTRDCPVLKQRCLKDKGDYWPNIAGIPVVQVDVAMLQG